MDTRFIVIRIASSLSGPERARSYPKTASTSSAESDSSILQV
jgi:hypothetical protein